MIMNPQSAHNLILLEENAISIAASFSGDRTLLYQLDSNYHATGYSTCSHSSLVAP